jgi:4-coumarate--CoA ligase (photoactive yellow protein activation family)
MMAGKRLLDREILRRVLHSLLRSVLWNRHDWRGAERLGEDAALPVGRIWPDATASEWADLAARFAAMFGCQGLADELRPHMTCDAWLDCLAAGGAPQASCVTFHSSGSTGAPAACQQALAVLGQEVGELARIAADRKRVVSVVPQHHIYGFLFSLLLPRWLAVPTRMPPPLPTSGLGGDLRAGDLLIAFPAFWKGLAALGMTFPEGVQGVTSTGPCPPEALRQLRRQGLETMLEVYGSSETSGVGYRRDPDAPYRLFRFWEPVCLQGSHPDALVRHGDDGRLSEPIPLPDEVTWCDARTFRPLRRRDRAVQVAGVNVYPQYVASRIREHPAVADCNVRLMRSDQGARLKAFVVPADPDRSAAALRRELAGWCRRHLKNVEQPRTFTFGARLPTQGMGKSADW